MLREERERERKVEHGKECVIVWDEVCWLYIVVRKWFAKCLEEECKNWAGNNNNNEKIRGKNDKMEWFRIQAANIA